MAMKVVLWRRSTWHRNKIPGSQSCLHNSLTAECIFNHIQSYHIHHSIQYSPKYIQVPTWDTGRKWQTCLRSILRSKLSSSRSCNTCSSTGLSDHRDLDCYCEKMPKRITLDGPKISKDLQSCKNPCSEKKLLPLLLVWLPQPWKVCRCEMSLMDHDNIEHYIKNNYD